MRWLLALTVIVVLLLAGGALTVQIASYSNDSEAVVPFLLKQTDDPEASPFEAVPWQTSAFFVYVAIVLFNLVGIGVTILAIMWFLNRGVLQAKAEGEQPSEATATST